MYIPVVYALISNIFFVLTGIIVKSLNYLPLTTIVTFRTLTISTLSLLVIYWLKVNPFGNNRKLLFFRGILGGIALFCYFATIQHLPLSTAIALQYTAPLFSVLFAKFYFNAELTLIQFIAIMLGFFGILFINNFKIEYTSIFYISLGLLSSALSGIAYTAVSKLGTKENSYVIILYFAITTTIFTTPLSIPTFLKLNPIELTSGILLGLCAFTSQIFITKAYQSATVAVISPIGYLNIVLTIILDYFIYNVHFSLNMIIGIILVVICNLITIFKQ